MENKFEFIVATNTLVSENDIITDLENVAKKLNKDTVTQKKYAEHGKYDCSTVIRKFNTWNKALEKAKLKLSNELNIMMNDFSIIF